MTLSTKKKPDWETEVYPYVKKTLGYHINRIAGSYSQEIKEDMFQNGFLEAWKAYERIDEERETWKSYINTRCSGSIKDFIKGGKSSEEHKWQGHFRTKDDGDQPPAYCLKNRTTTIEKEQGEFNSDVEAISGVHGIYHELPEMNSKRVKFDLLSRMASKDDSILLVAKWLIGFSIQDASTYSDVSRERFSQKLYEFFDRLDKPESIGDKWINQTIYALGLCDVYGTPEVDNGEGWDLEPADIFDEKIIFDGRSYSPQMNLFGEEPREYNPDINFKSDTPKRESLLEQQKSPTVTVVQGSLI